MTAAKRITMGMPQLDIHTLSEDWALATAMERLWELLAESLGSRPPLWRDADGARMYCAAMAGRTEFDLARPVAEDDEVAIETTLLSIRKPHAWGRSRFLVAGQVRAEVHLLTSFIKRDQPGSNKKFSKVKGIWQAPDLDPDLVEDLLTRHHAAKTEEARVAPAMEHEVNRIQDFNNADFLYFKNFVRIAKTAEWRENRGRPTRLNARREFYYFGNVEDGEVMRAHVGRNGDALTTELTDAEGRRLFLSKATAPVVDLALR